VCEREVLLKIKKWLKVGEADEIKR
jgi:hypothetical protein